ncbi:hypothetical protein HDU76_013306 [Blyttiomyces sp. JEL0837]|nr:hypothetical protein HDU76_013306 [Blyttiomyces sp. JEL0837]
MGIDIQGKRVLGRGGTGNAGGDEPPGGVPSPSPSSRKQACSFYFATGRCKYGENCKFSHDPNDNVPGNSQPSRSSSTSDQPCSHYWKYGKCQYGGKCKYKHVRDPTTALQRQAQQSQSRSAVTTIEPRPDLADLYRRGTRELVTSQAFTYRGSVLLFSLVDNPETRNKLAQEEKSLPGGSFPGGVTLENQVSYWRAFIENARIDRLPDRQEVVQQFVLSCLRAAIDANGEGVAGLLTVLGTTNRERSPKVEAIFRQLLQSLNYVCDSAEFAAQLGGFRSVRAGSVSFQRSLVPFVSFLTSAAVVGSTMHEQAATIVNFVRMNLTELLNTYLRCSQGLLTDNSPDDPTLPLEQILAEDPTARVPLCLSQVYLPIIRCIFEIVCFFPTEAHKEYLAKAVDQLSTQVDQIQVGANTLETNFSVSIVRREMSRVVSIVSHAQEASGRGKLLAAIRLQREEDAKRERGAGGTAGLARKPVLKTVMFPERIVAPGGMFNRCHDNDFEDVKSIQVIPTHEEIMGRSPALPGNFQTVLEAHWLPFGARRLIDTNFRLLREDVLRPVRNNILGFLEFLTKRDNERKKSNFTLRDGRLRGNLQKASIDINVYERVRIPCFQMTSGHNRQLCCKVVFQGPSHLSTKDVRGRQEFWTKTDRLMFGGLVALIFEKGGHCAGGTGDLNKDSFVIVLGIVRNRDVKLLAANNERAEVLVEIPGEFLTELFLKAVERGRDADGDGMFFMVEANKVMFESYRPVLKTLQQMTPEALPFMRYFAPEVPPDPNGNDNMRVGPPLYASTPDFRIDLNTLLPATSTAQGRQMFLEPCDDTSRVDVVRSLPRWSTLDEAQSRALVRALSAELVCIQGPPGTGKSYVGVQIVRALLENKRMTTPNEPILLISFSNHALDQFLTHIMDAGYNKVARLGGRSQDERIQAVSLQNLVKSNDNNTRRSATFVYDIQRKLDDCKVKLERLNRQLSDSSINWSDLRKHLQIKRKPRSIPELEDEPYIWSFTKEEKLALIAHWKQQLPKASRHELVALQEEIGTLNNQLDGFYKEEQTRILKNRDIVAATTSGVAKYRELLGAVAPRIIIAEEAGEVLEAHILACLHSELHQLILIGDHQQLRPRVACYDLSMESKEGSRYRLDMSLFERLQEKNFRFPLDSLSTQRRMRPEIADLIRVPDYPGLKDGDNVKAYPNVLGVRQDVFWVDHREPEDSAPKHEKSHSASNRFETEYAVALLRYLLSQGYEATDIVVLCPYVGQFLQLRERLSREMMVFVSEEDVELLRQEGVQDDDLNEEGEFDESEDGAKGDAENDGRRVGGRRLVKEGQIYGQRGNNLKLVAEQKLLSKCIRISTVDNFQGEESKIVIATLVRSGKNEESGTIGFLRNRNRIIVLLSRAKYGLYLIGNSAFLSSKSDMWRERVELLTSRGQIGPGLPIYCKNHPEAKSIAETPLSFTQLAPDGGCTRPCVEKLEYLVMFQEYGEVNLNDDPVIVLSCGHVFTVSTLDGVVGIEQVYRKDEETGKWELRDLPTDFINLPTNTMLREEEAAFKQSVETLASVVRATVSTEALQRIQQRNRQRDFSVGIFQQDVKVKVLSKLEGIRERLQDLQKFCQRSPRKEAFEASVAHFFRSFPGANPREVFELVGKWLHRPYANFERKAAGLIAKCLLEVSSVCERAASVLSNGEVAKLYLARRSKSVEEALGICKKVLRSNRKRMARINEVSDNELEFVMFQVGAHELNWKKEKMIRNGQRRKFEEEAADFLSWWSKFMETHALPSFIVRFEKDLESFERMLGRIVSPELSKEEIMLVMKAMETEFSIQGHWYTCVNGHPYSIGECGGAMEQSQCPECGAPIGGQSHRLQAGNREFRL